MNTNIKNNYRRESNSSLFDAYEEFRQFRKSIEKKGNNNNLALIKQIEKESFHVLKMIDECQKYIQEGIGKEKYQVDYSLEEMSINRYEVSVIETPLIKGEKLYQMYETGTVLLLGDVGQKVKDWVISKGLTPVVIPIGVKEAEMTSYFTDSFVGIIGIADKAWREQESYCFVKQMFFAGKHTANAWYKKKNKPFFVAVTKLGGTFGINSAEKDFVTGSLSGLCKSAVKEWADNVAVHYIDLKSCVEDAEIICHIDEELLYGKDVQVGYPEINKRVTLGLRERYEAEIDYQHLPNEEDVFIVAGGAEGVTSACILEFAKRFRSKFILIGINEIDENYVECYDGMNREEIRQVIFNQCKERGEHIVLADADRMAGRIMSQRQMHETMRQMEDLGCKALYYQCDINDRAKVHNVVQSGEKQLGKITGIVHGAGIISNSLLNTKTEEGFEKVFGVKYNGINNMMNVIDSDQLKYLFLYSSIAAFFGNFGQTDYSCGNEYLNNYARYFKTTHPNCKVMSLNWGPWNGGMVDRALKTAMIRRGKTLIDLEVGKMFFVDAFAKVWSDSTCQLVINDVDDLGGSF